MLVWLSENLSTIIIISVVLLIIVLDIIYLINSKKKGKKLCGNDCAGCALRGQCHNQPQTKEADNINSK